MRGEETAIEIISEFMSPFEDSLTVLLLGDQIDDGTQEEITAAFNNIRKEFTGLPNVKPLESSSIDTIQVTTSDLFRGKVEDLVSKEPCVIYMDKDLSRDVINILTNNNKDVDELDAMLLERYVIAMGQEKFIFDLSNTDDEQLGLLLAGMDERVGEFNYIIVENLLGVWIYNTDEFTMIQIP